jgi:UrcA family protein
MMLARNRLFMMPVGAALIASACLLLPAQHARAEGAQQVPTVTLRYNPNDLATQAGTRQLYTRLVMAAREVCPTVAGMNGYALADACRRQALAQALQQINDARLTQLVAAK